MYLYIYFSTTLSVRLGVKRHSIKALLKKLVSFSRYSEVSDVLQNGVYTYVYIYIYMSAGSMSMRLQPFVASLVSSHDSRFCGNSDRCWIAALRCVYICTVSGRLSRTFAPEACRPRLLCSLTFSSPYTVVQRTAGRYVYAYTLYIPTYIARLPKKHDSPHVDVDRTPQLSYYICTVNLNTTA